MTSALALPLDQIKRAVIPVLVTEEEQYLVDSSKEPLLEVFARGVWSRISEPGDSLAGWLIENLGPLPALRAVIDEMSVEALVVTVHSQQQGVEASQENRAGGASSPDRFQGQELLKRLEKARLAWRSRLDAQRSLGDFRSASRIGARLLTPEQHSWPTQLHDLRAHSPHALWIIGQPELVMGQSLAVVGSRAATNYGEFVTREIVHGLVQRGITIVSGGAYGIDAIAHRAALMKNGATIAVFAGGIDRRYPSGNENLFDSIADNGLLCAEQAPGSSPTKWRFLQRNRIIAALANATLVCEAGHRSGSLNTAGHASELARPVGAVPGPVTSVASAGCHRLLREYSAICVCNSKDALELLPSLEQEAGALTGAVYLPGQTPHQRRTLDALSMRKPKHAEEIARSSGMDYFATLDALAEMNLLGLAHQLPGGWLRGAAKN